MNDPPRIGAGAALSAGLKLTLALGVFGFLLTAARAGQAVIEGSLATLLFATLEGHAQLASAHAGAAAALWLIAELGAACVVSLAVIAAARRLRGAEGPVSSWPRLALAYFLVGGAVMVTVRLWTWTALGATFSLYFRALLLREGGAIAALALAAALTLSLPLGLFATLWIRTGLASAAVNGTGFLVALFEAVARLRDRLGAPVAIVLATGVIGGFLSGAASAAVIPFAPPVLSPGANELNWAISVMGGVFGALAIAFSQLWGIFSLTALEASAAGHLGPEFAPRPHPPIPVAPLVPEPAPVQALPVDPASGPS